MHDTQTEVSSSTASILLRESADHRVIIASGYDLRVAIRSGQLCITDGIRTGRRTRMISRADGIKRIILLADTGYVTLEAMRWCTDEGILVAQYDRDGQLITHSGTIEHSPRIVLAQSLASAGIFPALVTDTIRSILAAKLAGQATVARNYLLSMSAHDVITEMARHLDKTSDDSQLIGYEGRAANTYWKAWKDSIIIAWSTTDNLPSHWLTPFKGRVSGTAKISTRARKNHIRTIEAPDSANRGATDPINAMLNYAYRIAETEAIHACLTHGLNPGIGLQHHQIDRDRSAMALDMMEPARPLCDQIILDILAKGAFNPRWCYETKHGVVRLYAPLTHMIASQCLEMARCIEPHVAALASELKMIKIPKLSFMS